MTTRVKGPSDKPPVNAVDGIDPVAPEREVGEVGQAAPAHAADAPDAVAEVAARLKAGELSVDQAVELLIDDVIARQVARAVDHARDFEPQLRDLLRSYASSDPFLAAKIRRLTLIK
jgi:hypothetical protein